MRRHRAIVFLVVVAALAVTGCSRAEANGRSSPRVPAPTFTVPDGAGPTALGEPTAGREPSAGATPSAKASGKAGPTPRKSSAAPPPPPPPPRPALTVPGPAGSIRGTGNATVALTFDDGPDPVNTPALLSVLRAHNVKATFCLVGARVEKHPDIVRQIAADGHTLCNHSWQHLEHLAARDDSYLRWDLLTTNQRIQQAVPGAKIEYFRNPYGRFTTRVNGFAAELGMKPIYWDVDDDSWNTATYGKGQAMVDRMIAVLTSQTRPGSIVLSHDNLKPHTALAYDAALPWLKARFELAALP